MKMHSFVLLFVWRRKFLILFASLLFLVGIWAWAIFYTAAATKTTVEDDHKILSVRDFDRERGSLLQRLGFGRETDTAAGVKFVKPTGTYVDRNRDKHFKQFDSFLMDKDAKKVLQNLQMPSRDEISRRREADHLRNAAERQAHYEHELNRMGIPVIAGLGPGGHAPPAQRLVHLDLKGAPPKINYIKRILPIVKSLGATGLLLEYEDMFPFSAPITEITAKNSYNKAEIKDLLHTAASLGLTVMPLIQTFGHLEFVLKLNEFQQLREVKESPQSLCPSFNESMVFIEKMVSQIIELHTPPPSKAENVDLDEDNEIVFPNFTHLHIGCDEVYQMGECSRCRDKAKDQLFLSHVIGVSSMIKKRWPHLKVIIWDDMLRHVQLLDLQESHIGKFVEPMVWVYAEDIYRFITSQTWDKYATVFQTAWTASAFKGAHGENLLIPPAKRHLENNLKWLAVIQSEGARFTHGIQGIALTGWQRYDHFAMLCELLPTALPSLALCLATVSKGYFDVDVKDNPILSALTCPDHSTQSMARRPWLEMNRDPNLNAFSKCMFPGSPLYRFIIRLTSVTSEAREYLVNVKQKRGWITSYNVQHNFSSPPRVENLISEAPRLTSALVSLAKNAEDTMFDIYDKWTITEFIELHILPLVVELKSFEDSGKQLMTAKTWPRRPLPYSRDLGKYDLFKVDKN